MLGARLCLCWLLYTLHVLRMAYAMSMRHNQAAGPQYNPIDSNQRRKRSRWVVLLLREATTRWRQWCLATTALLLYLVVIVVRRNATLPIRNDKEIKYILYYTPFWNHEDFKFGLGQGPFEKCRGAKHRCFVTNNRSHFESMSDFDAIVFHSIDFNPTDKEFDSIKQWRKPHQRFVYFSMQSRSNLSATPANTAGFLQLDCNLPT